MSKERTKEAIVTICSKVICSKDIVSPHFQGDYNTEGKRLQGEMIWGATVIVFILQERKQKQVKIERTVIRTKRKEYIRTNMYGFQM